MYVCKHAVLFDLSLIHTDCTHWIVCNLAFRLYFIKNKEGTRFYFKNIFFFLLLLLTSAHFCWIGQSGIMEPAPVKSQDSNWARQKRRSLSSSFKERVYSWHNIIRQCRKKIMNFNNFFWSFKVIYFFETWNILQKFSKVEIE